MVGIECDDAAFYLSAILYILHLAMGTIFLDFNNLKTVHTVYVFKAFVFS